MKRYILYIFYLATIASRSSQIDDEIFVVNILADAQYFETTLREVKYIGSSTKIAYWGDYSMYIVTLLRQKTNDVYDKQTQTMTSTVIKTDTAYLYHVIKNGSKAGLVYGGDKVDTLKGKTFHLDTLFKYQGMNYDSYRGLSLDLGQPTETVNLSETEKIEKYFYKKTKKGDPDSIYRYYDTRLKNIDFTYSPSLDKKSQSKLVRTRLIYNPTHDLIEGQNTFIPRREMNWSLTKINLPKSTLRIYFDKFIKDN